MSRNVQAGEDPMDRVNRILRHPTFRAALAQIEELERERPFCGHGLEHLLSVARLAHLYNIGEGHGVDLSLLYAAALLHDIGRGEQYLHGTPHAEAGARLADSILADCGFPEAERQRICAAIAAHRQEGGEEVLAALLHRADRKSRPCFLCTAADECNWPPERRNLTLEY
jgi:putative nucleotidyltransferase with HDIG domain